MSGAKSLVWRVAANIAARPDSTIPGGRVSVDVDATDLGDYQVSMMRDRCGDMPAVRTGLTVTLPALPDASSIFPLPR
ncbi:Uncharacterised protein [Mycobacteroides abscessus subsp. abscessus]|nr:Uncharacterised protein [Mycobacteroides abscessus subsp. abscessus]